MPSSSHFDPHLLEKVNLDYSKLFAADIESFYDLGALSYDQECIALIKSNSIVEIRNPFDFELFNRILPLVNSINFLKIIAFKKNGFILLDNIGQIYYIDKYTIRFEPLVIPKVEDIFPSIQNSCLIRHSEFHLNELRMENNEIQTNFKFKTESNLISASLKNNIVTFTEDLILQIKQYESHHHIGYIDFYDKSLFENSLVDILFIDEDTLCITDIFGNIYIADISTANIVAKFTIKQKKSLKVSYSKKTKKIFVCDEKNNFYSIELSEDSHWSLSKIDTCLIDSEIKQIFSSFSVLFVLCSDGCVWIFEIKKKSNRLFLLTNSLIPSLLNSFNSESNRFIYGFDNKIKIFNHDSGTLLQSHQIEYKQKNLLIKSITFINNFLLVIHQQGLVLYEISDTHVSQLGSLSVDSIDKVKSFKNGFYILTFEKKLICINFKCKIIFEEKIQLKYQNFHISSFNCSFDGKFCIFCLENGVSFIMDVKNGYSLSEIPSFKYSVSLVSCVPQKDTIILLSNFPKKLLSYNRKTKVLTDLKIEEFLQGSHLNLTCFKNISFFDPNTMLILSNLGYCILNQTSGEICFKRMPTNEFIFGISASKLLILKLSKDPDKDKISAHRKKISKYGY